MTAGIQAGALKRVHSVQFGGVPCLPSVPEVIFPVSPPTCVPLANTLFALVQILSCGPSFTYLGRESWAGLGQILA